MHKILILNGPNLNMLGQREPEIYGTQTLDDIEKICEEAAKPHDIKIDFRQSNSEAVLVNWIQESLHNIEGLIINAAAYTHTSVAIHDALKLLPQPIIEVHLSDPEKREEFRHISFISPIATEIIKGEGDAGYSQAIEILSKLIKI